MFKEIGDERTFNGILDQITDNIQSGRLKAGDALPAERTMAETMGVSRPAVREALRALELLGIIKPVPGGGNYIADDLDSWLIGPLSILFKLNNGYIRQNQQPCSKEMYTIGCSRTSAYSGSDGYGRG